MANELSKQTKLDLRYLRMARIWAENSYCKRRQVGALVVKDKMIISDGYNGNLTSKQNGSVGGYMVKKIVSEQPLNFNSIFYIIPRVIVNYRTTFPGIQKALRYRQNLWLRAFLCLWLCVFLIPEPAESL